MFFQKREACDSDNRDRLTKTKQIAQRKVSKIKKVHRNVLRKRGACDSDKRDRLTKTKQIAQRKVSKIKKTPTNKEKPSLRIAGDIRTVRPEPI